MNASSSQPSSPLTIILKSCHPERSLAESEANRQTQSKDPYHPDATRCDEKNFRIAVRFFDEHELLMSTGEAVAWQGPARQCRVNQGRGASPAGTTLSHLRITQ